MIRDHWSLVQQQVNEKLEKPFKYDENVSYNLFNITMCFYVQ